MKKETVKDRMLQFLAEVNISQGKFEKKTGLSNGFINNIGDTIRVASIEKIKSHYPRLNTVWLITGEGSMLKNGYAENERPSSSAAEDQNHEETYQTKRRNLKTTKQDSLMYYEIGASAGTRHTAEILPVKKEEGVLHISDLFKGSEYAIRVSGNSMTPNYPSGAIIGIREIHDKHRLQEELNKLEQDSKAYWDRLNEVLPLLTDLKEVFLQLDINKKHAFIRWVFDQNISYYKGKYRTPSIEKIFEHNLLKVKEKGLLEIEKPLPENDDSLLGRPRGSLAEHLLSFAAIIAA